MKACTTNYYVYSKWPICIMKIVRLIIMFMYRPICIMEDCTSNYYAYVQVNIYYEDCISNHYVYVQVNMYYGRLYI